MEHFQNPAQTNVIGIAYTSSNPLAGYQYGIQNSTSPLPLNTTSAYSILARTMAPDNSISMSRSTSSSSYTIGSTVVVSSSESDSDTEHTSISSFGTKYTSLKPVDRATNNTFSSLSHTPFTAPPVILLVGGSSSPSKETNPVPFYVHDEVLTAISPFFRAAFELNTANTFSEGLSRTMKLPEDRPEDIAYLLQWTYWQLSNMPLIAATSELADRAALSLWHPSIDIPLSHYQAYKTVTKANKVVKDLAGKMMEGEILVSQVDALDWQFAIEQAPSQTVPDASVHEAQTQTQPSNLEMKPQRPPPPTFGPLVRLFILADKYALPMSLKQDICQRVRDVGKTGKCVPDADDIFLLWDSIYSDVDQNTDLKQVVLEMYAALSLASFRGLFFGHDKKANDEEDVEKWHPLFMRDLMGKMF